MDNSVDLPGYKYFVDQDGNRPAVRVTFLNLVEADDSVNGVLLELSAAGLAELDARERNYERRSVGDGVWAYFGTRDARARYDAGPAVVGSDYLDLVRSGFEALGQLAEFERTTDPPGVPVWDLRRVDLPW